MKRPEETGSTAAGSTGSGSTGAGGGTVVLCGDPAVVATPQLTQPKGLAVLAGKVWVADPSLGKVLRVGVSSTKASTNKCSSNGLYTTGVVGPWEVAVTKNVTYSTTSANGEVNLWTCATTDTYGVLGPPRP